MALDNNPAATDESTPPDKASSTFPSPTFSRISLIVLSTKASIFQSPAHPQTPNTKLDNIVFPSTVWSTSGWNWIAYKDLSAFSAVATGQSAVCAEISNPGATCEM